MILFEFDDCYKEQSFYKDFNPKRVDLTALEGVNGYCDDEAKAYILKIMKENNESLAFFGNGNYHYMSYLALHKIECDFSLVVFDHHTDMQPSFFEELLSCGCWIKHGLENLSYLKSVLVLGVKKELLEELSQTEGFIFLGKTEGVYCYEKNRKHVICVEEAFFMDNPWQNQKWCEKIENIFQKILEHSIYISIDKDVLLEVDCVTNWDAGSMSLETMMKLLSFLEKTYDIVSMDVCGEWDKIESSGKMIAKNNRCNEKLVKWWKNLASVC